MSRRRRWLRRLGRISIVIVLLLVTLRFAAEAALPFALDKAAARYGLEARYERFSLSVLGGSLAIDRLEVRALAGGEPLLQVNTIDADLVVSRLFRGDVYVRRAVVDGLRVSLTRGADGRLVLPPELIGGSEPAPPDPTAEPEPAPQPAEPDPPSDELDLELPIVLEDVRVTGARVSVFDLGADPQVRRTLELDVRLSDFGREELPFKLEVVARAGKVLDILKVRGRGHLSKRGAEADLAVELRGLHLREIETWLAPLGIRPTAHSVDGGFTVRTTVRESPESKGSPAVSLLLEDTHLRADGVPALVVDRVVVDAQTLSGRLVSVPYLGVHGVRGQARRMANRALRVAGVEFGSEQEPPPVLEPSAPAAEVAAAPAPPAQDEAESPPDSPPESGTSSLPVIRVSEFVVSGVELAWIDEAVAPVADLAATVSLSMHDLIIDDTEPDAEARFELTVSVPGVVEALEVHGAATPNAPGARAARLEVRVPELSPGAALPYLGQQLVDSLSLLDSLGLNATLQEVAPLADLSAGPGWAVTLSASAPGAFERLSLQGRFDGIGRQPAFDLQLRGEGLSTTRALGPLLEGAGLHGTLEGGTFAMRAHGRADLTSGLRSLSGGLSDLSLRAPDGAWLTIQRLDVDTLGVETRKGPPRLTLPVLRLTGLSARVVAAADGSFEVLGVRTARPARSRARAEELSFELEAELRDLDVDLGLAAEDQPRLGHLSVTGGLDGAIDRFGLEADFSASPHQAQVRGELEASGVALDRLKELLAAKGLESRLQAGRFRTGFEASVQLRKDLILAEASVTATRFGDGDQDVCSLEALRVEGVEVRPQAIAVGAIVVERPWALLEREPDGKTLRVLGLRTIPPRAPEMTPAVASSPVSVAVPAESPAPGARTAEPATEGAPAVGSSGAPSSGPSFRLDRFVVHEAGVTFVDRGALPDAAATLEPRLDVSVLGLAFGGAEPAPARARVEVRVPGVLTALTLDARLGLVPGAPSVDATLAARGLRAGPLERFLPPGVESTFEDGRLDLAFRAGMTASEEGGASEAYVELNGLALREGERAPMLEVGEVALRAPYLGKALVEIDEVVVRGVKVEVTKDPDGLVVPGARLLASVDEAAAAGAAPDPTAVPATATASTPAAEGEADAATSESPRASNAAASVSAKRRFDFPDVIVRSVDVGVAEFRYHDRSVAGTKPLNASLRLTNRIPIELVGEDPASSPPLELEWVGRANPMVESIRGVLSAELFHAPVTLHAELVLQGISGPGIHSVLPGLEPVLDLTALESGRYETQLSAELTARKTPFLAPDLRRPIGLALDVENALFFPGGEHPPMGVHGFFLEAPSLDFARKNLHLRRVEVVKPSLHVRKTDEGIRLGPILVRAPAAKEPAAPDKAPATRTTVASPEAEPETRRGAEPGKEEARARAGGDPTPVRDPPVPAGPKIVIDEFVVSGVDASLRDESAHPPLHVPLANLEVRVRNFDSHAAANAAPLRFEVLLEGGLVSVPKDPGGFVAGVGGAVTGLFDGDKEPERVERPIFEEISLRGELNLSPALRGHTRASVNALRLSPFQGVAAESGVELGGGEVYVTSRNKVGLNGFETRTHVSLGDLAMSEPEGGPVQSYLGLKTPVSTAVFLLRNEDGVINIPLNFEVGADGVSGGQIVGLAAGIVGRLLAEAVASAPLRVVGSVTEIGTGLLPDKDPEVFEPVVLRYLPGEVEPALGAEGIDAAIERLADESDLVVAIAHELGDGEQAWLQRIADPALRDRLALVTRLTTRRDAMRAERSALHEHLSASLGLADKSVAEQAQGALLNLDQDLALVEAALSRAYAQTRDSSDRVAARRARAGGDQLIETRLERLRERIAARVRELASEEELPAVMERIRVGAATAREVQREGVSQITLELSRRSQR